MWMMHKISLATLFSGIGAPEFAAREVFDEVETVFACEIDKFARKSYLANHDTTLAFYEDVCDLDAKAYAEQIDILIGGSPCQDFSIAGQRAGEDGERGNLIWQFYRIASEARPKVFVYENVKGFLSINGGKSYQRFFRCFARTRLFLPRRNPKHQRLRHPAKQRARLYYGLFRCGRVLRFFLCAQAATKTKFGRYARCRSRREVFFER